MKERLFLLGVMLAVLSGCGSSATLDTMSGFADKMCACQDAACAKKVEAEYLDWWKNNKRARGSDSDHKSIEEAGERFATCSLQLVGPPESKEPLTAPKVDLQPVLTPPRAMDAGPKTAPADLPTTETKQTAPATP